MPVIIQLCKFKVLQNLITIGIIIISVYNKNEEIHRLKEEDIKGHKISTPLAPESRKR